MQFVKTFFLACLAMHTVLSAGPECGIFKNKEYQSGKAVIQGTAPGSTISGTVSFQETAEGLKVSADINGLPPGKHGFHIHEFGDISDSGKAAGGHYNPKNNPHGDVVKQGIDKVHAGDFGNLDADSQGHATKELIVPGLWLSGKPISIAGRAVIIHEKVDDFSQPVGNAGSRIAGGTIMLVD